MDVDPLEMSAADQAEIHRVQRIVQVLLRSGLAAAVVLMAVGVTGKVITGVHAAPAVKLFALGDAPSWPDFCMALGVLVLAATPALRVLALVVLWSRERDWHFVAVACVVVMTLTLAILVGRG